MTATIAGGAQRRRAISSTPRVLGAKVAATLARCRSLLDAPVLADDELERIGAGDLDEAMLALERASKVVTERLTTLGGHSRTVRVLRVQELLAELQSLWHELQVESLTRQIAMLGGIRDALHRLRGAESTSQMIERATIEACRSCGVDRCVLLRVEEGKLMPESVCFGSDEEFGEEWSRYARANPPVLDPRDPEVHLLRRNVPIMVRDPADSRGLRDVAEAARSNGYVAAPLMVHGNVIGTLHADLYFSGARVNPVVRDVLAAFAEGLDYALERTILLERSRSQLRAMREMVAEACTTFEELFEAGLVLRREEDGKIAVLPRGPAMLSANESRLLGLLTRRELEVVELMARGASNADIANELVISEGTVKSHVKHILRKMRAANRAQAVSCYMRLQSLSAA